MDIMSATIVIVASTSHSSIQSVQRVLDNVRLDSRSLGLSDVKVTHYRDDSGAIWTPDGAGMGNAGDVTVGELTAPQEEIRPDVRGLLDQLADLTAQVRALTADRG